MAQHSKPQTFVINILNTKKFQKKLVATTTLTMAALLAATSSAYAVSADDALPSGFNPQAWSNDGSGPNSGKPTINGAGDTVTQTSTRAVIGWTSFDIGKNRTFTIDQKKGASAITINKISNSGINPTTVAGHLNAQGRVVILDPNGVLFTSTSQVDVGSLVASTGSLGNQTSFINSGAALQLTVTDNTKEIKNQGNISIKDSGMLAFVAPYVKNDGTITARLGNVNLVSGKKVTVDFTGDDLISIEADQTLTHALAENKGTIEAAGGLVTMTANAASSVVDTVVNMSGTIKANTYSVKNGKIVLSSTGGGKVSVSGLAEAKGGTVEAKSAKDLTLTSTGKIDTSGDGNQDGGDITVYADNTAIIQGRLTAKGGASGGKGGLIETSGNTLTVDNAAVIDASAALGVSGTWLLDPLSIVIGTSGVSGYTFVSSTAVSNTLTTGTNVTIQTGVASSSSPGGNNEGDIRVLNSITNSGNSNAKLTLIADDDLTLENGADIRATGGGALSLDLQALGTGGTKDGYLTVNSGSTISTNGGAVSLSAEYGVDVEDNISSGSGNISITASKGSGQGDITVKKLDATGGSISLVTDNGQITLKDALTSLYGNIKLDSGSQGISTYNNADLVLWAGGSVTLLNDANAGSGAIDIDAGSTVAAEDLKSTAKDVTVDAGNNIDLNGAVTTGGSGKVAVKTVSGNITADGKITTNTGSVTLDAEDGVDVNGGIATNGGAVSLLAGTNGGTGDDVTVDGDITTKGGNVLAVAGDDVRIHALVDTGKSGGAAGSVTLKALGLSSDASEVEISGGNSRVSTNTGTDGNVTIVAEDVILGNGATRIEAGGDGLPDGTVTIQRSTNGTIGLGSASGGLSLSQSELNTIKTDGSLIIGEKTGDLHTTNIYVGSADLSDFGYTELNALAASSVNFTGNNYFGDLAVNTDTVNVGSGKVDADSIWFNAPTVNLNGDLDSSSISGTASTVNVQGSAGGAQINDGVDVAASGATVNVAAGTYNENVLVDKSLTLKGANVGRNPNTASRLSESVVHDTSGSAGNSYGFKVTAGNVTIDGFKIDVDGNGVLLEGGAGGLSGFTVQNNKITVADNDGVEFSGGSNVSVLNNTVGSTSDDGDGVKFTGVNNATISGNTVNGTAGNGVSVTNGTGTTLVSGNQIGQSSSITGTGVKISGGSANTTVSGNTVDRTGGDGVSIASVTGPVVVSGNFIGTHAGSISGTGVKVTGTTDAAVSGNTIATAFDGVYASAADGLDVTGNSVTGRGSSTGTGVKVESSSGVKVANNGNISSFDTGVSVTGGSGNEVTGNTVSSVHYGVTLSGTTDATVSGNTLTGNSTVGVSVLNGSDGAKVKGNTVTHFDTGIKVDSSENADVVGNDLTQVKDGVYANAADGLEVYDNDITGYNSYTGTGVKVENSSNVKVGGADVYSLVRHGLRFSLEKTADRDNRIGSFNTGVSVKGGADNDVVNNTVGTVHYGVTLWGTTDALVKDNSLTGNSTTGISVLNGSDGAEVENNTITHFDTGIKVDGSEDAEVEGNKVTDVYTGLYADEADGLRVKGNKLSGRGNTGTGISVEDSEDVVIGGWDVTSVLGSPLLEGNKVESFRSGIVADDVSGLQIAGNLVQGYGSWGTGIKVTGSDGAVIGGSGGWLGYLKSNVVKGFYDGIQSNWSDDVQIKKNIVEGGNGDGVRIYGGENVTVAGNFISNVGRVGVWLKNLTGATAEDNRTNGTGLSGIRAEGGEDVTISGNTIDNAGTNGVSANGTEDLTVEDNEIGTHGGGISDDGVQLVEVDGARVLDNAIASAYNGVTITDSNDVDVTGNTISAEGTGIFIDPSSYINVYGNAITGGSIGIDLLNSDHVNLGEWDWGNTITGAATGIRMVGSSAVLVEDNEIADASYAGISLEAPWDWCVWGYNNNSDVTISGNYLSNVQNGILSERTEGLVINEGNEIYAALPGLRPTVGIGIYDGWNEGTTTVDQNTVWGGFTNGIEIYGSDKVYVTRNEVYGAQNDGIQAGYNGHVEIGGENTEEEFLGNFIVGYGDDGIQVANSGDTLIAGNFILGSNVFGPTALVESEEDGNDEPELPVTTGIRLGDNEYFYGEGLAYYGVSSTSPWSGNSGNVTVLNNLIAGNATGLDATAANNHGIAVSSNVFSENTVGLHISSGLVDLTHTHTEVFGEEGGEEVEVGNQFYGGDTAMIFDGPSPYLVEDEGGGDCSDCGQQLKTEVYDGPSGTGLSLVGDTLGHTWFEGQKTFYVELRNGAFFAPGTPTIIDGTQSTWDGVKGEDATAGQLALIESKINDYDDDKTLGQIFVNSSGEVDDNLILQKIRGTSYKAGKAGIVVTNGQNQGGGGNTRFFSVQDLANLEPAAGGNDNGAQEGNGNVVKKGCWSNVAAAMGVGAGGAAINLDLSEDQSEILADQSACEGGV